MDFNDKIVLVTGAAKSLGRQIAYDFAKNGARVIINYNNSYNEAKELKNEIDKKYNESYLIKADISNESEVKSMFDEIKKVFSRIDIVVNNAGISIDNFIEDKDSVEFKKVLDVNLLGTYLVSKYAKELLSINSSIINISSDNALRGYVESVDYDASKAGVVSLTKNFAKYYAPTTRVNAVLPGWINTEMNKDLTKEQRKIYESKSLLKRFASPSEISNVVLFLASDKSSYVNATCILVNGGYND